MTGKSHTSATLLLSVSSSIFLYYNYNIHPLILLLFIICSTSCSKLPDQLEKYSLRLFKHRTVTHSLLLFLIVLSFLCYYSLLPLFKYPPSSIANLNSILPLFQTLHISTIVPSITIGIGFGYFSHLILDSFSHAGIPILLFGKPKLRFALYKTSSLSELIFLVFFCTIFSALLFSYTAF